MQIHELLIENFHGITRVHLQDLPAQGVILVDGPNESGKSTILQALNFVRLYGHTSQAAKVTQAQPYGQDVGPAVFLHATIGDCEFKVRKQWLRSRKCELEIIQPYQTKFTGRQAEDQLAEIYKSLDSDLLGALFIEQGELKVLENLESVEPLRDFLAAQEAVGNSGGGDAILQAVKKSYEQYFTSTHREKKNSEVSLQAQRVAQQQELLEQARRSLRRLEESAAQLATSEEQLAAHQAALPKLTEQQAQARAAVAGLEKTKHQLEMATQETAALQTSIQGLQQKHHRVQQLKVNLEAKQTGLEQLQQQQTATQKELVALTESDQQESLEASIQELSQQVTRGQAVVQQLENQRQLRQLSAEVTRNEQRFTELAELAESRAELQKQPQITQQQVQQLRKSTTDVQRQEDRLAAQAIQVRLAATEHQEVTVESQRVSHTLQLGSEAVVEQLHEPTTFTVGAVSLEVSPSSLDQEMQTVTPESVAAAQSTLAQAFEQCGVNSLEQADQRWADTVQVKAQLQQIAQREAQLLAGQSMDQLQSAQQQLLAARDQLAAQVDAGADADVASDAAQYAEVSDAELDDALTQHRQQVAQASETLAQQRQAQAQLQNKVSTFQERLTQLTAQLGGQTADVENLAAEYEQAVADADPEALTKAQEAWQASQQQVQLLQQQIAQAQVQRVEQHLAQVEQQLQVANNTIARLQGQQEELRQSLRERDARVREVERYQSDYDVAAEKLRQLELRRDATELLYNRLQDKFDAMTQRYAKPLQDAMEELAGAVYDDDIRLAFDSKLVLQTRRSALEDIPVADLSGGAQEQLALIQRVSVARLVGQDSAIFVDDPLGASDPQRQAAMAQVFQHAAAHSQVFVLTCDAQRFAVLKPALRLSFEHAGVLEAS